MARGPLVSFIIWVGCLFRYRAMFDVMPLPLDWPAEVNYHQARAFCAWKGFGFRLPTEAERNVMKGKKVQIFQCVNEGELIKISSFSVQLRIFIDFIKNLISFLVMFLDGKILWC